MTGIAGAFDELLDGSESASAATIDALLTIVPPVAVTRTVSVIDAVAPLRTEPRLQVMVVVPLQLPCDGTAETAVSPAGSASVTTTLVAAEGPALPAVNT